MRMLIKLTVAFCVATVLAQFIILGMSAVRGNLHQDTLLKTIALVNGVDISGDRLQKMLQDSRDTPNPKYEDVQQQRARLDRNLDMRETAIKNAKEQVETMLTELRSKTSAFERRTEEFYAVLDKKEKQLLDDSLKEVQRTLEALSPDQAKDQLMRMLEGKQLDDVVAIVKGMAIDKRKKILGEFINESKNPEEDEPTQLNIILMRLRQGEPTHSLIEDARESSGT